jgi:hypothetical protein
MEVKTIVQEIQRLPLSKKFFVMEQTLKAIKKEELNLKTEVDFEEDKKLTFENLSVNEKSLAKDWLSEEDSRWDELL